MLAYCFHEPVLAYAADQHYQSHFVFLWVFFAAAMIKVGRGRVTPRVAWNRRSVAGAALGLMALGVLHVGLLTGSSTAQRLALVCAFTAGLLLLVVGWSTRRCLGMGGFMLLCFGVPYSAYFALTRVFRQSFVDVLAALPDFTPLQYEVSGLTVHFASYTLAITADCSGFNQLVTFLGLAFLGCLTARTSPRRAVGLFALGAALAYASNLVRIVAFLALIAAGQHQFIDQPQLHAAAGFIAYAPFILFFVWVILRTHRPVPRDSALAAGARVGLPAWALLVPLLAVRALHLAEPEMSASEPRYMASLEQPPVGYHRWHHAPSEEHEKGVYGTPWLENATYGSAAGEPFELFAYLTRDRRHLAVHQVSHCLDVPGTEVRYGPSVEVAGRRFWSLELVGQDSHWHGFYAFWIDGEDRDDSWRTQVEVLWRRLAGGGVTEVGMTRLLRPGPLEWPLPEADRALLTWRARQLQALGSEPTPAAEGPARPVEPGR